MLIQTIIVCLISSAQSVEHGFEQYTNLDGNFWIFNTSGVEIFDPDTKTVVKRISSPTSSLGDVTYIRDQAQVRHYVFANDPGNKRIDVYDTDSNTFIVHVPLKDANPIHMYAVYYLDEIWSHDDASGEFNIFRMAQIRYRSQSGVSGSKIGTGHGKLLFNPNLEDVGFITSVNYPGISRINIRLRETLDIINLNDSAVMPYQCRGTHGIEYSPENNRLYVECSNPPACAATGYKDPKICYGSLWGVDAVTFKVVSRLVSPSLSLKYGAGFGIFGQPYHSPEYTLLFVPSANLDTLHILYPRSNAVTLVIDVSLSKPGAPSFHAKNRDITFGLDRNASNYWAIVPVSTGVAFIDLATVMSAFAQNKNALPDSAVTIVTYDTGGKTRLVEHGGHYVISGTYTSADKPTGLVVIDAATRSIAYTLPNVGMTPGRILWVPIHTDELRYAVNTKFASYDSQISDMSDHPSGKWSKTTRMRADGGVAISVIALILSIIGVIVGSIAVARSENGIQLTQLNKV